MVSGNSLESCSETQRKLGEMSTTIPRIDPSQDATVITRELCDIPSESSSEREIADAISEVLAGAPHLEVTRNGDTIIARTALGRTHRVIIAGHLDTVPVHGNLPVREAPDPMTGERMLWGRGTVDMKAGVAIQLKLAVELTDPVFDVTWVWYDHEEVAADLNGLGRVLRRHPELFAGDLAILGEPSGSTIEGGCNGTLRACITFHGRRAHSARAWMGVNAIERAAPLLTKLADYQPRRVIVDGLEYREGLSAVGAQGGVAGNVIPDRFELLVNYRFAPHTSEAEAADFVRKFFADADEVEIVDSAPGARPGLTHPLVQGLAGAVGEPPRAKQGWTDVSRFAGLGIPAVNFGPGDPQLAHADDERVSIAEIERTYAVLRGWLSHAETASDFRQSAE